MIRIRSFAVFASLFLAAPILADSAGPAADQPTVERASPAVDTAKEVEAAPQKSRRLSTRDRWRGTPYTRAITLPEETRGFLLPRMSDPTQTTSFANGNPELRSEALNRALPVPSLGTGGAF